MHTRPRTRTPRMLAAAALLLACGAAAVPAQQAVGTVTVTYTLHYLPRIASNQLAVWIEGPVGRHVRTLFATDFMARRRGFRRRPPVLLWTGRIRVGGAEADSVAAAAHLPDASAEESGPLVEEVRARFRPRR